MKEHEQPADVVGEDLGRPEPVDASFLGGVIVQLQVMGVHAWPECPYPEVAYLRNPHRHVFHIRAYLLTTGDRAVEILRFQHKLKNYLEKTYATPGRNELDFQNRSCEQLAHELLHRFGLHACDVLEDGENGAWIFRKKVMLAHAT